MKQTLRAVTLAIAGLAALLLPARAEGQGKVARLLITPNIREVAAGDTVRFSAQAVDASGNPVAGVRIRLNGVGGEGGEID